KIAVEVVTRSGGKTVEAQGNPCQHSRPGGAEEGIGSEISGSAVVLKRGKSFGQSLQPRKDFQGKSGRLTVIGVGGLLPQAACENRQAMAMLLPQAALNQVQRLHRGCSLEDRENAGVA